MSATTLVGLTVRESVRRIQMRHAARIAVEATALAIVLAATFCMFAHVFRF